MSISRKNLSSIFEKNQQAIAMAAIVADKLNNQKLNGGPEFQSDSNIADSLRPNHQRLTTLRERRLSLMKVCI